MAIHGFGNCAHEKNTATYYGARKERECVKFDKTTEQIISDRITYLTK